MISLLGAKLHGVCVKHKRRMDKEIMDVMINSLRNSYLGLSLETGF